MSEPAIRLDDLHRLAGLLPDCTPPRTVAEIARAAIDIRPVGEVVTLDLKIGPDPALSDELKRIMADAVPGAVIEAEAGPDAAATADPSTKAWTQTEEELLVALYSDGRSLPEIAATLGRSIKSVDVKRRRLANHGVLGAAPLYPQRSPLNRLLWSEEDDAILTRLWGEGAPVQQILAALPGRTERGVMERRRRLGLPARPASGAFAARMANLRAARAAKRAGDPVKEAAEQGEPEAVQAAPEAGAAAPDASSAQPEAAAAQPEAGDVQPTTAEMQTGAPEPQPPVSEVQPAPAAAPAPIRALQKTGVKVTGGVAAILEAMAGLDDSFEPADDLLLVEERFKGAGISGIAEMLGCDEATVTKRWKEIRGCKVNHTGGLMTAKGWADLRAAVAYRAAEADV